MNKFADLIARLEGAEEGSREFNEEIGVRVGDAQQIEVTRLPDIIEQVHQGPRLYRDKPTGREN